MPFYLVKKDITKMEVDAIVNAANKTLLGGGGVDGAIHRAAGPSLLAECRLLGGCETGDAKITGAGNLTAKYVIHTVGPVWCGGLHGEREALTSCYQKSLRLAEEYGCESIAFPLISAGIYRYPKKQAYDIAKQTILDFLENSEMTVYLVLLDCAFLFGSEDYQELDTYLEKRGFSKSVETQDTDLVQKKISFPTGSITANAMMPMAPVIVPKTMRQEACAAPRDHEMNEIMALLHRKKREESFSQMLLRKIDELGMSDPECYKKANVDRKLFSKIRSDSQYHPSKQTALAFAVALELDLEETKKLLQKAGFALSSSFSLDVIVEYYINKKNYNIHTINEALLRAEENLLGA